MIGQPWFLPCRTYAYVKDKPPFGISQDILTLSPEMIPFLGEIRCDSNALKAETNAGEVLGWTTGKMYGVLKKANVIQEMDQRAEIQRIVDGDDELAELIGDEIAKTPEKVNPLSNLNELDQILNSRVATRMRLTRPHWKPRVVYIPTGYFDQQRTYLKDRSEWWAELFLSKEFSLFPEPTVELQRLFARAAEIQRPRLADLAALKMDFYEYQDRLAPKERKVDERIDEILTKPDDQGFDCFDKLDDLIQTKKAVSKAISGIRKLDRDAEEKGYTKEEFLKSMTPALESQKTALISIRKTAAYAVPILIGLGMAAIIEGQALGAMAAWAEATYIGHIVAEAPHSHPLGYVALSARRRRT